MLTRTVRSDVAKIAAQVSLTNAQREALQQNPAVAAIVNAVASKTDEFGGRESAAKQLIQEPLWSRVTLATPAAAAPNPINFFTLATGDGITQTRYINGNNLEGSLSFKVQSVALTVQDRLGRANWNAMVYNGALFGDRSNSNLFNFPGDSGIFGKTVAAGGAATTVAATTIDAYTGPDSRYGMILERGAYILWPRKQSMLWSYRFTGAGPALVTPPDGVDNFILNLILHGEKSQDVAG